MNVAVMFTDPDSERYAGDIVEAVMDIDHPGEALGHCASIIREAHKAGDARWIPPVVYLHQAPGVSGMLTLTDVALTCFGDIIASVTMIPDE